MHPLIILIIIAAVWLTVRHIKSLPPEQRRKSGFKAALLAAGALLLLALVTGRLSPLIAVAAAAIPVMQRLMTAKSLFDQVKSTMGGGPGPGKGGDTRFVSMAVDPVTGKLTGTVRDGQFAGRALGDLSVAELIQLLDECRRADAASAAAVASYLRQHHPEAGDGAGRGHPSAGRGGMSEKEAREILGVSGDADRDEILTAHRRLMQRLHPDRGGSDYLASKINQAKDLLLRTG